MSCRLMPTILDSDTHPSARAVDSTGTGRHTEPLTIRDEYGLGKAHPWRAGVFSVPSEKIAVLPE